MSGERFYLAIIPILIGCGGTSGLKRNEIDPEAHRCETAFAEKVTGRDLLENEGIRNFSPIIPFKVASSELLLESQSALDSIATFIRKNGKSYLVAVHSDKNGPPDKLKELSRKRALAIVRYLSAVGVDSLKLSAVGLGSQCFIGDEKSAHDQRKNRRVEFIEK